MSENPYAAPASTDEFDPPEWSDDDAVPLSNLLRPIFLSWEKLRLVYNAILVCLTLLLTLLGPSLFAMSDYWISIATGALLANGCFFLGPAVEGYVAWLGFRSHVLRISLFVTGTLFSCALAAVSVISYQLKLLDQP